MDLEHGKQHTFDIGAIDSLLEPKVTPGVTVA